MYLYIRPDKVFFSSEKWVSVIKYFCEKINPYWAFFTSSEDYYEVLHLLQRNWLLENNNDIDTANRIKELLLQYPEFSNLPYLDINLFSSHVDNILMVPEIRWINYWSKEICEFNNFPDSSKAFDKQIKSIQLNSGGYIWALTEQPWKIIDPTHRQQLVQAYQRFPNIGLRLE